ncbi:hypothetical protein UFOVP152_46 [uncultured Caudovirales phage]|uniref:Uncharacterized protein n=1 Tax=uncultured Caudovirales phage TaxID=2100421 RepID=A0A6J7WDT1_9CAUD|nr:hypothetical protein UFOVP152_46 [uncultured Caudovirales phage]
MLTHYQSSKGAIAIDGMALRYAANALNKLRRDEPERSGEIEALAAHVAKLEANPPAAEGETPPPMGHNGSPPLEEPAPAKLTTWDVIKVNFDDLLTEAGNWADGVEITTQDQADSVGRLRGMLQQAVNAADDARVAEKKPLDDQIAAIQDRYNAYIAPLKNRQPGSASKAIAALGNLLTKWLNKQEEERRAREAEAAKAAAEAAAKALSDRAEAKESADLSVMDRAEESLAAAEALLKQAKGVSREKVQAGGGEGLRAQSLRTSYVAEPTGEKTAWTEALKHYLVEQPDQIKALLQQLASADVRDPGKRARGIPGFTIREVKGV